MRSQEQRDEQTLAIATALGLFVVVMLAAVAVLGLIAVFVDVSGELARAIVVLAIVSATALAVVNLVRATRL